VPRHVELARERAGDPPLYGVGLGDARELPFRDETVDVVLLLGPLYHLGEARDRARAVREAERVCRPGGLVFASAISRYAPLLDTIRRGRIGEEEVFTNVQAETSTGRRVAPGRRTSPFPDAYIHLPAELEGDLAAAGMNVRAFTASKARAGCSADSMRPGRTNARGNTSFMRQRRRRAIRT